MLNLQRKVSSPSSTPAQLMSCDTRNKLVLSWDVDILSYYFDLCIFLDYVAVMNYRF